MWGVGWGVGCGWWGLGGGGWVGGVGSGFWGLEREYHAPAHEALRPEAQDHRMLTQTVRQSHLHSGKETFFQNEVAQITSHLRCYY